MSSINTQFKQNMRINISNVLLKYKKMLKSIHMRSHFCTDNIGNFNILLNYKEAEIL